VAVPKNITLGKSNMVIQFAIGWESGRLHEFDIAGKTTAFPISMGGDPASGAPNWRQTVR
jgi:hypothetical protein